ncbi:MAG: DUF11 domain-containing protein [Caldilineae bacterium]|nr:DUF11 domain-containing protein [Caldilineae bacterium]
MKNTLISASLLALFAFIASFSPAPGWSGESGRTVASDLGHDQENPLVMKTWDGGGDGVSWSDPLNWDPNGVPTAADDVEFSTNITVNIDVAAVVNALTLTAATLEGSGDLTIQGLFTWHTGTLQGSGTVTASGGVLLSDAGTKRIIGRTLDLMSDTTWDHSTILFGADGVINHHAGFTLTIEDSARSGDRDPQSGHLDAPIAGIDPLADITDFYAFNLFGDVIANTSVTHQMSTQVSGGYTQSSGATLFDAGSQLAGTMAFGDGAGMTIGRGTHLAQGVIAELPGATPSPVVVNGNQTEFRFDPGNAIELPLNLNGPTGIYTNTSLVQLAVLDDGPISIAPTSTLSITGGLTLDGYSLDIVGGGVIRGRTSIQQNTTLSEVVAVLEDGSVINANTGLQSSATIQVPAGMTTTLSNADVSLVGTFNNFSEIDVYGTFRNIGDNRSTAKVVVGDGGGLYADSGYLRFSNSTIDGNVTGNSGAGIQIEGGGTSVWNDGSGSTGPVEVLLRKGSAPLIPVVQTNGDVAFSNLTINEGTITISGTTTVSETFVLDRNVYAIQFNGTPADRFVAQGSAIINSGSGASLLGIQLILQGDTVQQPDSRIFFQSDARLIGAAGSSTTIQGGEYVRSGLSNPWTEFYDLYFDHPGDTFVSTNVPMSVTHRVEFVNGAPQLGAFTLAPTATMSVTVQDPGPIFTAAELNLDGTLNLNLPPGFSPALGEQFSLATTGANGVNGQFHTVTGGNLGGGLYLAPIYSSNEVVLEVVPAADVKITKSAFDHRYDPGDQFRFTLNVSNGGPDTASNVVVTDIIDPDDFTINLVQPSPACDTEADPDGIVTIECTFANLAPGEARSIAIDVTVVSGATNTASVSADTFDPLPGNNASSWAIYTTDLPPEPDPEPTPSEVPEHGTTQEPKRNADASEAPCGKDARCPQGAADGIVDPVYLHSGEFFLRETDLHIPGRGLDYEFTRTYRSQVTYDSPLGFGWQHNYDYFLVQDGNDITVVDGYGRADTYSSPDGLTFSSPAGHYNSLVRNPDGAYTLGNRHGMSVSFNPLDGSPAAGKLNRMQDAYGNFMTFDYTANGRLDFVVDTMGRTVDYVYNEDGRLDFIEDFAGRRVQFLYDGEGDLVMVTSPAVTGTPNGNDFPDGKRWVYTYASATGDPALDHNLLAAVAPNEAVTTTLTPRVVNTYGTSPAGYDFDRLVQQQWGGINETGVPAGGTVTLSYQELNPGGDRGDLNLPRNRTTVIDRNGNQKVYEHNVNGNRLSLQEFSNRNVRPSDPVSWTTTYEYNADGELTRFVSPLGNSREYLYDASNGDRLQQGNLLGETALPDPARGGDQASIITTMTYEPIYNQARTVTDPRGNDPGYAPPNGGATSPARYTTMYTFDFEESCDFAAIGAATGRDAADVQLLLAAAGMCAAPLGDVNGDGRTDQIAGNAIRTEHPAVNLLPGSNMAGIEGDTTQEIVEIDAFNDLGQLLYHIDPEGNVTDYLYFPETDPDGDGSPTPPPADGRILNTGAGGYRSEMRRDTREITGPFIPERRNHALCPEDLDGDGGFTVIDIVRVAELWDQPVGPPVDRNGNGRADIADVMWYADRFGQPLPCPDFVDARRQLLYDPVGNVVREVDGRGIATDHAVNQLNQVVQTTRAAAHQVFLPNPAEPQPLTDFQYLERTFYDFNDNEVLVQVEDRGNTSGVDGSPPASSLPAFLADPDPAGGAAYGDTLRRYDILDHEIATVSEVGSGLFLTNTQRYDPNGNVVLIVQPEGNAAAAVYDERDLLFQNTDGALGAPALALLAPADPVDFDARGGLPATQTFHYDANRNLVETVDAEDTDGSPDNNSDLGGDGERTRYLYDGYDRQTSTVDSLGNQTVTQYDPAGNAVRVSSFGPLGGPSPTSDGPDLLPQPVSTGGVIQAGNLVNGTLLEATEMLHDEASRLYQVDEVLFLPLGATTVRPVDIADGHPDKGNLTPGDSQGIPGLAGVPIQGRVSTRMEYDRSARLSFTVEDDLDTWRRDYDGAGRVVREVDPVGNRARTAYDDNNNVLEIEDTQVATLSGVGAEIFLTTVFYDSLDRADRVVDNLGQTMDVRYDSRDNPAAVADAEGPVTGATIQRRAFSGGGGTVNEINDFGNVTRYTYDGLNRNVMTEYVLTASGQGDGLNIGADLFGVPGIIPAPDPAQGGGDGLIQIRQAWDGNSLTLSTTDDDGNRTEFTYDNLDRLTVETRGLTGHPGLADRVDPPTSRQRSFDRDGNIVQYVDENGSIRECSFDGLNRTTGCAVQRAGTDILAGVATFNPVIGTTATGYEYDGLSRKTLVTDNNEPGNAGDDSTLTYVYDSLGRALEDSQQIGAFAPRVVDAAWRAGNLLTVMTYPNDREVERSYDRLDRVHEIRDLVAPAMPDPIAVYDYIGPVRQARKRYQNGTVIDQVASPVGPQNSDYDGSGRTLRHRWQRETDQSVLVGLEYDYTRSHQARFERKLHDLTDSELYIYDSVYRVTQIERGLLDAGGTTVLSPTSRADVVQDQSWMLDGAGNWNAADTTINGGTSNQNRLTTNFNEYYDIGGAAQLHDDSGNLNDDSELSYQWDSMNRLRRVTRLSDSTVIAEYAYDGLGRRISKSVPAGSMPPPLVQFEGTTHYAYLDNQVIEEYAVNGAVAVLTQQYVYGSYLDEPLVLDRNLDGDGSAIEIAANGVSPSEDQRLFYHDNHLHSVFGLSDETGELVEAYEYDAFGRRYVFDAGADGVVDFASDPAVPDGVSAVGNHYFFTGRRLDEETGLYHYRNRAYSDTRGRFLSRDPYGPDSMQSLYAYVNNNPANLMDPLGLRCVKKEFGCSSFGWQISFKLGHKLARLLGGVGANPATIEVVAKGERCSRCCGDDSKRPCRYVKDGNVTVTVVSKGGVKASFGGIVGVRVKGDLKGGGDIYVASDQCNCAWKIGGCAKVELSLGVGAYVGIGVADIAVLGTPKVACKACMSSSSGCYGGKRMKFKASCCLSGEISVEAEYDVVVWKNKIKWTIMKWPSYCPGWLKFERTLNM